MRIRQMVVIGFAGVVMVVSAHALQRRDTASAAPADARVDVSFALQIAGQPYQFNGKASCRHAPVASIYDVPAEMWSVQQSGDKQSLVLTLWRPKGRAENWFSLAISTGGKSYSVNTVETGRGAGPGQGRGKLTFAPLGPGGTFTIDATAAKGGAISGSIKCSAFTPLIAEGGE